MYPGLAADYPGSLQLGLDGVQVEIGEGAGFHRLGRLGRLRAFFGRGTLLLLATPDQHQHYQNHQPR